MRSDINAAITDLKHTITYSYLYLIDISEAIDRHGLSPVLVTVGRGTNLRGASADKKYKQKV